MGARSIYLLLGICLFVLVQLSYQRPNDRFHPHQGEMQKSQDFDYLILRQIWPASSCMFPGPNTCTISKNISTWVVHGLWPSIKTQIGPSFCNKSLPFNFNNIKWLLPVLMEFWPNLYTNTPLESFWKHEWEKHGTCALSLPEIQSESDYFNVSLSLRTKYDFGPILKANSIQPDDTLLYDLNKIRFSLKSVLNVEPMIVCYVLRDSDVQYLSQMQVCLSKNFELVDCAFEAVELVNIAKNNSPQETQCQPGIPIHYPTIKYASSLPFFKKNDIVN